MTGFLRLFKNIKKEDKGARMIQLSIYHHKFKFIINLVNFSCGWVGKELILREQQRSKTGKQPSSRFLVFQLGISMWREAESRRQNKESILLE